METDHVLQTGVAALLLAATFLVGNHIHPLRWLLRDDRGVLSFGAGMSMAYVFVHVMPELHGARHSFTESVGTPLPFEGGGIYFVALLGFLTFYGVDHFHKQLHKSGSVQDAETGFRIQLGGFAVYAALIAYLLVHNLEDTGPSTALYAVAMVFHFLTIDHSLREEQGSASYGREGRFVLAGMCGLGWGTGLLVALPPHVIAVLVAFISGGVIMNSTIMELPSERDGRFGPFLAGGLIYGLILLPLG